MAEPIDEEEKQAEDDGESEPSPTAQRRAEAVRRRRAREALESGSPATSAEGPRRPRKGPFEFRAEHNPKFSRLGKRMTLVAIVDLVGALIGAVWFASAVLRFPRFLPLIAIDLIPVLAAVAVGLWTYRAGQRFGLIASTQGSDVVHLMAAIDELNKLYLLQVVALLLGISAIVIGWLVGAAS